MQEPKRFPSRVKILAAAITVLTIDAGLMLVFGNRQWKGLETLVTAADLIPLAGTFWPIVEALAGAIFFVVSYAGRKVWGWLAGLWRRWWRSRLEKAYRKGYNARMMEERQSPRRSDGFDAGDDDG